MRLIVGLGNPGSQYARTRHNVGFMVVDRLAARHDLSGRRVKFHAGVLEGRIHGQRCVLMQPTTYMNRSGLAVREAVGFYQLDPQRMLVIVDDTALPCGTIRLRAGGSAGGHNGLSDIECVLNTSNYPRLRIGVDPPGPVPQADYVLRRFTPAQLEQVEPALEHACDAIECWLVDDIERVMSRYNAEP
ncbi:MAG: aminoacyl-tRNA hydrolase [Phycisphaeraceae bacterium]